jgi:hypothetical protein
VSGIGTLVGRSSAADRASAPLQRGMPRVRLLQGSLLMAEFVSAHSCASPLRG